MKIYQCTKCDQLHLELSESENVVSCCKKEMILLEENIIDVDEETHLLIVRKIGNFIKVSIGKKPHPMIDIHFISLIILETNKKIQFQRLKPGDIPVIDFLVTDQEELVKVYAYCTVHSLLSSDTF